MKKLPTLKEFGKRLPIGYREPNSGEILKPFSLRPWDWDLEEQIGEALENSDDAGMGHVSHVVAASIEAIGNIKFDKLNELQRRTLISSLYYSDVVHMYVWIRVEAMGQELKLETFNCDKCKKSIEFVGDLRELDVEEVDRKAISRTVTLEHGIQYANERRKKVIVEPVRWSFFESNEFVATMFNPAKFKRLIVQQGVVELEGAPKPAHLTTAHLKSMKSNEILKLVREINEAGGGPIMAIEGNCPQCRKPFQNEIDWRYGDFFGRSVP